MVDHGCRGRHRPGLGGLKVIGNRDKVECNAQRGERTQPPALEQQHRQQADDADQQILQPEMHGQIGQPPDRREQTEHAGQTSGHNDGAQK